MKTHKLLIFLSLTIFTLSCKKDKLVGDEQQLIGTWECQYSWGGFAGDGTDFFDGKKLHLYPNGRYKFYEGSTLIGQGKLVKDDYDYYSFRPTRFYIDDQLSGLRILSYYNDSLDIGFGYCCDTYVSVFTKK